LTALAWQQKIHGNQMSETKGRPSPMVPPDLKGNSTNIVLERNTEMYERRTHWEPTAARLSQERRSDSPA